MYKVLFCVKLPAEEGALVDRLDVGMSYLAATKTKAMSEKELLQQILANQVVLFREIEKIQDKLGHKTSMKGYDSVVRKLNQEANKVLEHLP